VGNSERYLGYQVSHDSSAQDHWTPVCKNLAATSASWKRLGLTIFGRTLLVNSCLLSKIWFLASHAPVSRTQLKSLLKEVNNFFKKGKKNNSVAYAKRVLPKEFGGLGQLDPTVQIALIQAKWVIRALSGEDHLWAIYWRHNEDELRAFLKSTSHPTVANLNWAKLRPTSKNKLFPMLIAAYKGWHSLKLTQNLDSYERVLGAPNPLYNNIHILL